ncbi:hypothetical protein AcV5_004288 [Taiwanofungus camphoratus]|nr:hypothetical protein AcV5_004288 [Antrodia cinnamomea]
MVKKKQVIEELSEEEEQFHVEVITKARVNEDSGWDYYVKWANYDSDANTWEPEENVQGCERLLNGFWKDVGTDNEDYPPGYIVHATPSWIAREKAFFSKTFGSDGPGKPKNKKKRRKEKVVEKGSKQEPAVDSKDIKKRKHVKRISEAPSTSSSKNQGRKLVKKRTFDSDEYMSDESDDEPLLKKASKLPKRSNASIVRTPDSDSSAEGPRKVPKASLLATDVKLRTTLSEKGMGKAKAQSLAETDETSDGSFHSLFSEPSLPDIELSRKTSPSAPLQPQPPSGKIVTKSGSNGGASKLHERRGIKEMPLEFKDMGGGRGIATKVRLAQGASVSAVQPKPPATLFPQKIALANLSFKKNTAGSSAVPSPTQETRTAPRQDSFGSSSAPFFTDAHNAAEGPLFVQSPVSIHNGQDRLSSAEPPILDSDSLAPAPETRRPQIPLPRRSFAAKQASPEPMEEADQFLSTIMPPTLAAPMEEESGKDDIQRPAPVPPPAASKQGALGRIPKKWKWLGELFINVDSDRAEHLCNVSLFDPTDPRPNGLRFSICLNSVDSMRFNELHNIADLHLILGACAPVQQFAKLGPQGDADADAIRTLMAYMRRRRAFTYARAYLDGIEVALVVVFPSVFADLCKLLKVPQDLADGNSLIAALVPWELTHEEYKAALWQNPRTASMKDKFMDLVLSENGRHGEHKLTSNRFYHRAIRILQFPKSLHEFMSQPNRPYCIWYSPADGTVSEPGIDTLALRAILTVCGARDVGYKADVRVIFVHVGALSTLHNLHVLAIRRYKRPDLRFYTYGAHETVPPTRWGIRDIFPLGGIITFTPSVIIEHLAGICSLIKKIDEHPLWECYLLPSVVALVAKLTCQEQNPLTLFDKGECYLGEILSLIEQGRVSLLRAPPLTQCPKPNNDPAIEWVGWQLRLLRSDARGLLEECMRLATEQYPNTPEAELPIAIQQEITRDLLSMQMQPAIMDKYRRFVVVKTSNDHCFEDDKDGLECTTLPRFDFRDDFFPKSEPGAVRRQGK